MTTLNRQNAAQQRKILIKSTNGKVIRQTKVHNPNQSIRTGWTVTGNSMRQAIQEFSKTTR